MFNTREKRFSAWFALLGSLLIVTPLCGFLFQCGCDWPGLGLDEACNFYKTNVLHKCPWCTSIETGIISIGLALIAAIWASTVNYPVIALQSSIREIIVRCSFAILMFVLIAILTAGIAAYWQGYPLGKFIEVYIVS